MRASVGLPGMVHDESEMPSERTPRATRSARLLHLRERRARAREMAGDLVHEERARRGRAAAARPGMRDVVGDDHHLDVEAERARLLGGEAEVQAIAGVVLHDEQAARRRR